MPLQILVTTVTQGPTEMDVITVTVGVFHAMVIIINETKPWKRTVTFVDLKDIIEVIEHYYGGNIGDDEALVAEELKKMNITSKVASSTELGITTEIAKQKSHAIAFLKRADKHRYGILITELMNLYSRGMDQYPATITEAYIMLVTYK